jgi:hypothetical protein
VRHEFNAVSGKKEEWNEIKDNNRSEQKLAIRDFKLHRLPGKAYQA